MKHPSSSSLGTSSDSCHSNAIAGRHGKRPFGRLLRCAWRSVVENLESRLLLSATSDGFTASFFGAEYTAVSQFPAANTNPGDYSTHIDTINSPSGNNAIAPADAPTTAPLFNPNQSVGNVGQDFSAHFSTTVQVVQSGYYTFYPTTDDGAQVSVDGIAVGQQNLAAARGPTQDTDPATNEWLAGSTHTVDFYMQNGGGGWAYELRWSASSAANGGGASLIPYSLMTGAGAPGVANLEAPAPKVAAAAPTEASSTAHSITVTWSSHDVDASSYIVERSTNGTTYTPVNTANPVPSADGGTLTYIDTGLSASTSYTYKIISNSIIGATTPGTGSEPTSPASAALSTAAVNPALAAPLVAAAPSAAGNVLTITEVPNAVVYNVLKSSTVGGTYTQVGSVAYAGNISTVSYTDTGNNANSFYEVQAADSSGDTKNSNPVTLNHGDGFGASYYLGDFNGGSNFSTSAVFNPSTLAAAPTYSTIIPTINSGSLGNGTGPAYAPSTFNTTTQSTGPGFDFSTEFDFTVIAPYSEKYTFLPRGDDALQLTVDGTVIYTKATGTVSTGSAPISSTWTAGTPHTIQIAYFELNGPWETDLGWTSPTIAALNPAGFYSVNGQAVPGFDANALGTAPSGAPTAPAVANAPVLSVTGLSSNTVILGFTASEADSYNIYRGIAAAGEGTTPIATVTGSPATSPGVASYTYTDTNVTTGTKYYYVVKPVNSSGTGTASGEVNATPMLVAPPAPTNLTATLGGVFSTPMVLGGSSPADAKINVSWNPAPFATSYDVLRAAVVNGTVGSFATVASGITTTTYADTSAPIQGNYQYMIVARNGANPTGPSPTSTSAASATVLQGALEQFYANNQTWGSASDNGATKITGVIGTPTTSSEQPIIDYSLNDSTEPPGGTYLPADDYSTIWTGKVHITTSGNYTFYKNTDDDGILYVDGALVAAGAYSSSNINNGTILNLTGGQNYDFQLFQEQGAGGHATELVYSGPDTNNAQVIVPQSALISLTGAPLAASTLAATVGAANPAGTTYPVTVTFNDNADNEMGYELQRSSDAAFDGAGNVVIANAIGLVTNGTPASGGAPVVGAGTITDPSAPQGQTFYYRVVAVNFEGSTISPITQAVTIPTSTPGTGVEVNFYNNEWWRSTNQSTTAINTGAVASQTSASGLTSDEQTLINFIDGAGTDTGSGTLEAGATSPKYPDPAGTIGPDNFSDVFTGKVNITTGGTYTFAANTDDDGYLYVDDRLVSAYPGGHGASSGESNIPTVLTAGQHDIEFFQSNGGGAWQFEMLYSGPDTSNSLVVVPSAKLTSQSDPVVAPTGFTVVPNGSAGGATLTWNNNNTSAIRYVVERSADPSFNSGVTTLDAGLNDSPAGTSYPATSTFTDSGLTPNSTYYYRIYAQNYDGTSSAASASIAVPPAPPVGVVPLWTGSTITTTWVTDASASSYNVYRATTPGGEGATPIATGITTTSYVDANVTAGTTYYYEITAVNATSGLESGRSFEAVAETTLPSTVIITELQASNSTTLADAAGNHPDWVELYNPTSAAVNLNGYFLTDKTSDPTEWQIPSVSLGSGAFLVIFCDGTNVTNPAELHTNFSISASGEYLALVAPDGKTVLSSYTFGQQLGDGSYGVAMASTVSGGKLITSYGAVGYLNPTPDAQNGDIIGTTFTPEPTFNLPGGVYTGSPTFSLMISDTTPNASIYYTLDGTLPSATNGTLYTGPISVTGESDFRAVAIGPNDALPSEPNTDSFIYTAQVITQDPDGSPPPGWPASWGGAVVHYGMNPNVVNNSLYSGEIQQDLLSIPTFSVTMNLNDLFNPATGIYANSGASGSAWDKPTSVQYIPTGGAAGFTANSSIAIKGDASAASNDPKHGFRLEFSNKFGQSELDYPLFGPNGAQAFEEVDLRTDQNNSWQYQDPANFTATRDEFSNATAAALGIPGQRSQVCFLYINGVFWGLYDAVDRTDADWAANTYGGDSSDYDAIKSGGNKNGFTIEATDGTLSAWDQLYNDMSSLNFSSNANYEMIQGNNPDGTPNAAYPNLINVPELIQYTLMIDYVGNLDAPNSTFISNNPNNFYAVRPTDGSFGFQFMATDSEWTLLSINTNRVNSDTSTPSNETATPQYFFQQLEANPNFKQLVADDIQKDFFNNGPLTSTASLARMKTLAAQVSGPVVLESARWGNTQSLPPYGSGTLATAYTYTRNIDWQNAINTLENNYITVTSGQNRSQIVLGQLAAVGLTSSIVAPNYSQFGGTVPAGYQLAITNPNGSGSIYYTLDGSDPFTLAGALSPAAILYTGAIALNTTTEVKAAVLSGTTWSAETDATFNVAITTVRVTELDYDPPTPPGGAFAGDDDEFIELENFGTQAVNLEGAAFTKGVTLTFGDVTLAPGQVGVVVSNAAAFAAEYGSTSPYVLGSYAAGGDHFSNSGEEVTLVDATGATVSDFTYSPTWYPTTAGQGPSLEVVNPASNPNLNLAASWRPSPEDGGTPGVDDTIPTIAPTNLNSTIVDGQVALTWSAVAGAASYNVYRGSTAGGEGTTPYATGINSDAYTDTAAAGGSTYFYVVAAVDPGGLSPVSNETTITVPQTPIAPVITLEPTSEVVNVTGTATFTANAAGYPTPAVQWNVSTDGGMTWMPISGATSPTYSFPVTSNTVDGNEYQAVFSNSQGSQPTTVATLTTVAPIITAWNFDTSDKTGAALSTKGVNTSPDPSTGSGVAQSIGMTLQGGTDNSGITTDPGSSDGNAANQQAWKIVGTNPNGWTSTAPLETQGAQFMVSTVGYTSVALQFDLDVTKRGEGNLAVEYTTDGGTTWQLAPTLSTNGAAGISVKTNTTSPNTVQGEYFNAFNAAGNEVFYNRLTADFSGVTNAANNANFGVRLVNASTGADNVDLTDTALMNTSGNWRIDEVDIGGAVLAPTGVTATGGVSSAALNWTPVAHPATYNVYRGTTPGGENPTPLATGLITASYTDSTAVNGQTYYYLVTAVGSGDESAASSEVSATPLPAPHVTAVYVSSDAWQPAFLTNLAAQGLGSAAYGYAIPTGSAQAVTLPWINLDQVSVSFDQPIAASSLQHATMALAGTNVPAYTLSAPVLSADGMTVTWTVSGGLGDDRLNLALAGLANVNGTQLDGSWSNGASSFPSGNGTPGSAFDFAFNVLPGDVNQDASVSIVDTVSTRNRQFTAPGDSNYSPFYDVDGNGSISIVDTIDVRNRQFTSLPMT